MWPDLVLAETAPCSSLFMLVPLGKQMVHSSRKFVSYPPELFCTWNKPEKVGCSVCSSLLLGRRSLVTVWQFFTPLSPFVALNVPVRGAKKVRL